MLRRGLHDRFTIRAVIFYVYVRHSRYEETFRLFV